MRGNEDWRVFEVDHQLESIRIGLVAFFCLLEFLNSTGFGTAGWSAKPVPH